MKRGVGLKWSLKSLLTTLVLQIPEPPERAPGELNRVHRYERDRQVLKSWPTFSKTQSAKGTLKVSRLDTRGFSVSLLAIWSTPRIWRHQSNRKEYFHPTQLSCLLWACAASWYHSSVRESGTPCPSLHRQESETKSRTGEKSLSSLSFPWPGSSFLPWELYGVERKGGRWRLYCKFTPGRENQLKFLKEDDPPWLNPLLSPSPELIVWIIILDFF